MREFPHDCGMLDTYDLLSLVWGHSSITYNAMEKGCGVKFPDKMCYEGVLFDDISITKGWVGIKFPEKNITFYLT